MNSSDLNFRAIFYGVLIDILGSVCVGVFLGLSFTVFLLIRHDLSPSRVVEIRDGVFIKSVGLFGTSLTTCFGGYVATRLSASKSLANAFVVGLISLGFGAILSVIFPGATPTWKQIIGAALTIPASLLGGFIALRNRRIVGAQIARGN